MPNLFDYQVEGVDYIQRHQYTLLADPPGAGKSAQVIVAAERAGAKSVLVVCPASLRLTWRNEWQQWAENKWCICPIFTATTELPDEPNDQPTVVIVSYTLAVRATLLPSLQRQWDVVIFDEAHMIKEERSLRSRVCYGELLPRGERVVAITGTPMPNGRAIELYPLFAAFAPAEFGHFYKFTARYCVREDTHWGVRYNHSKNLQELGDKARSLFMLRRPKEEVLKSLPPLVHQFVPLEVPLKAFKDTAFAELEQTIDPADLDDALAGNTPQPALSTLRRLHGLAKMEPTIDFLFDLLEEGEPVIVFAHHKEVVAGFAAGLEKKGVSFVKVIGDTPATARQEAVDQFQGGKARVFLGSLTAAGTGLTLTEASALINVEPSWVPSDNEQAIHRAFRHGQDKILRVFSPYIPDSIDEAITRATTAKQKNINRTLEAAA